MNYECKHCGLLRSTVLATKHNCLTDKEHDFGDHGISFPKHSDGWEESFDDFYYSETGYDPDNMNIFHDEIELGRLSKETKEFIHTTIQQQIRKDRERFKKEIEKMQEMYDRKAENEMWHAAEKIKDLINNKLQD